MPGLISRFKFVEFRQFSSLLFFLVSPNCILTCQLGIWRKDLWVICLARTKIFGMGIDPTLWSCTYLSSPISAQFYPIKAYCLRPSQSFSRKTTTTSIVAGSWCTLSWVWVDRRRWIDYWAYSGACSLWRYWIECFVVLKDLHDCNCSFYLILKNKDKIIDFNSLKVFINTNSSLNHYGAFAAISANKLKPT